MADRASPLSKEVLPPQTANSGLAVIIAASLAMFLALASSAFVLQARVARSSSASSCPAATRAAPVTPDRLTIEWIEEAHECGTPVYDHHADGSVSVYWTTCKDDPPKNQWGIRSAEPPVIEVRAAAGN